MSPSVNFGDPRLPQRFWDKCVPEPMSGCWIWTAGLTSDGYGAVHLNGQSLAHRVAYLALAGPIPSALECDHLCRVRSCCNPAHLEPVTRAVNLHRSPPTHDVWKEAGRRGRSKTHCPQGHAYAGSNVILRRGWRECRTCDNARTLANYHRSKAT